MINFPFDIKMSQSYNELGFLLEFIQRKKIKGFVELGVHVGGLAAMMISYQWWNPGEFTYMGVEHIGHGVHPLVMERGHIILGDVFKDGIKAQVRDWVNARGRCIIYCDNGNKPKELVFYHDVCRVGDFILAHDYKSEVFDADIQFLIDSPAFAHVDNYLTIGTTIVGFERIG